MSNEAALLLSSRIQELTDNLNNFIKDATDKLKSHEKAEKTRIDGLKMAIREVCTHEGAEPIYRDERYEDYHHR